MKESNDISRGSLNYVINGLNMPEVKHLIEDVYNFEINSNVYDNDGVLWTEVINERLDANDVLRIRDTLSIPHYDGYEIASHQTTWLDYKEDSVSVKKYSEAETINKFKRLESVVEYLISKIVDINCRDI